MISMTAYTYENTRYVHHDNQIRRKMIVLLMYQMTESCTKITKHGLQSSFLTGIRNQEWRVEEAWGDIP